MSNLSAGSSVSVGPTSGNARLTLGESEWYTLAQTTTLGYEQTLSGRTVILALPQEGRASSITMAAVDWTWVPSLIDRFRELLRLPRDWDSYGAEPVRSEAALTGALIANACITRGARIPHIVPTVEGGVQLEWSAHGRDLEVEVLSPKEVSVLYREDGRPVWEGSLLNDPRRFDEYLRRLLGGR